MVKRIFFIAFFLSSSFCFAQIDTHRSLWVPYGITEFTPDSLTLDPFSLKVANVKPLESIDTSQIQLKYNIDKNSINVFYEENTKVKVDSFLVSFTVFPFNLSDTLYLRSQEDYEVGKYAITYQELDTSFIELPQKKEDLLSTPGIQKQGVITRALRMGNQQDATFNSALNLQLAGNITDDVSIEAVLSDQEIPFQPDGNTRQLREIDRVYLALKHKMGKLEAGDISFKNDANNYFLKYNKQVLGAGLQTSYEDTLAKQSLHTKLGLAMAKGQFASRQLRIQNGVMGPYRLIGNNNEPFIIIIAGSESIYLDGKKLQRGFDNDYIIDYNQAEITFNATILFNPLSRVRVEYEYVVQDFGRLISNLSVNQRRGNIEFFADWYREADNKNNPLTFSVDEQSFDALYEAGDSVNSIFVQPELEAITEYSAEQILYIQKDSIHSGRLFKIFERVAGGTGPFYRPNFIFVGDGNGNYIRGNANNNGNEFIWVAPVNGRLMGNYAVGNKISAPNLKQMMVLGGKYYMGKNTHVFAEAAFSNQDNNTLSDIHDSDNRGQAIRIGLSSKNNPVSFSEQYTWETHLSMERLSADFQQIDRFRNIEFQRSWGIFNQLEDTVQDFIGSLSWGISNKEKSRLQYQIGFRNKESLLKGFKHNLMGKHQFGRFGVDVKSNLLQIEKNGQNAYWVYFKGDVSLRSGWGINGYAYEVNHHNFTLNRQELISSGLSNYDAHTFYIKSLDTAKLNYQVSYNIRNDEQVVNQDSSFQQSTHTLSITSNKRSKKSRFKTKLNLRKQLIQTTQGSLEENSINGQVNWHQKLLDNLLLQELSFQTGTGRELKRDFVFLNVANGTGTHTWRDNNNNGIQELDEFFIALQADERNYAKFFVPSNEFVQVFMSNLRHKITIAAPKSWQEQNIFSKNKWKHFLSKWSFTNLLNANYRTNTKDFLGRFLPYFTNIPNENLVSGVMNLHSTLYFQRYHHRFGFDIHYRKNNRKQLLSGGYEAFGSEEWSVNSQLFFAKNFTQQWSLGRGNSTRESDFMLNQNYQINSWFIKPSISFQPSTKWKITTFYQFKHKEALNQIANDVSTEPNTHGKIQELSLLLKSNVGKNQQVNISLSTFKVDFSGNENSALGYEMLEGLNRGVNHTFRCSVVKKLGNGLQLQSTYIGRKPPNRKLIHTGNIQLSAIF